MGYWMNPSLRPAKSTISWYFSLVSDGLMPIARQPRMMLRSPVRSRIRAALTPSSEGWPSV
jgi:hypothetical protein